MTEAKKALERLSAEPSARALAESRLRAEVYHRLRDKQQRAEGREEGRAEARQALRDSIVVFARTIGLDTSDHLAELEAADLDRLQAILRHLAEHRSWPTPPQGR